MKSYEFKMVSAQSAVKNHQLENIFTWIMNMEEVYADSSVIIATVVLSDDLKITRRRSASRITYEIHLPNQ